MLSLVTTERLHSYGECLCVLQLQAVCSFYRFVFFYFIQTIYVSVCLRGENCVCEAGTVSVKLLVFTSSVKRQLS